jgi:hypothetical protein
MGKVTDHLHWSSVIESKQDQRIAIRVKDQLIRDSHEAIMALGER